MNVTLYNGKSGMDAFQKKLDAISNNIANAETSGYKKINVTFQELLKDEIGDLGTPLSSELESKDPTMGSGTKTGDPYRSFEQGVLVPSSNPLEVAIEGNGFMGFRDADNNLLLSRVGDISISSKGTLVDSNGNQLAIENPADLSQYSKDKVTIDSNGNITARDAVGNVIDAGKVILYDITNKESLRDIGQGYYMADSKLLKSSVSADAQGTFGQLNQGFSEMSNVDMGEELVEMIITQRAYQFNSKSIEAADEMWKMANNLRG